jgi:tetratricopeptide (TPR) repeat protein
MKKSDSFGGNDSAAKLVFAAESSAERRDWGTADELFRQAIDLDSSPASRIAYGVCLSHQERFFEAISVFTPILDADDRFAIGIVCHNLAAIYRDVGDLDLARRFQWRATLMQEDSGPGDLLAMANDALADECHQAAESLVMTALEMSDDLDDDLPDGDLIATSGLVQMVLNSTEEGLLTLFAAYRQHQAASDFRRMGADQLNMSLLFGELKRYRAERACLQRAIRCFEHAPAPYSLRRAKLLLDRFDRMRIVRSFNERRN